MANWIHVSAGQGSGNDSFKITVDKNYGAARSGSVKVTSANGTVKTINVRQAVYESSEVIHADFDVITVSPASFELTVGESISLTAVAVKNLMLNGAATRVPVDVVFTWSSSDPSIATVDASGQVTAVGAGSVTITASATSENGLTDPVVISGTSSGTITAVTPAKTKPYISMRLLDSEGNVVLSNVVQNVLYLHKDSPIYLGVLTNSDAPVKFNWSRLYGPSIQSKVSAVTGASTTVPYATDTEGSSSFDGYDASIALTHLGDILQSEDGAAIKLVAFVEETDNYSSNSTYSSVSVPHLLSGQMETAILNLRVGQIARNKVVDEVLGSPYVKNNSYSPYPVDYKSSDSTKVSKFREYIRGSNDSNGVFSEDYKVHVIKVTDVGYESRENSNISDFTGRIEAVAVTTEGEPAIVTVYDAASDDLTGKSRYYAGEMTYEVNVSPATEEEIAAGLDIVIANEEDRVSDDPYTAKVPADRTAVSVAITSIHSVFDDDDNLLSDCEHMPYELLYSDNTPVTGTSDAHWITLGSGTATSTGALVTLVLAPNASSTARSEMITLRNSYGTKTITIVQDKF